MLVGPEMDVARRVGGVRGTYNPFSTVEATPGSMVACRLLPLVNRRPTAKLWMGSCITRGSQPLFRFPCRFCGACAPDEGKSRTIFAMPLASLPPTINSRI